MFPSFLVFVSKYNYEDKVEECDMGAGNSTHEKKEEFILSFSGKARRKAAARNTQTQMGG
jgi:hypothetical protein